MWCDPIFRDIFRMILDTFWSGFKDLAPNSIWWPFWKSCTSYSWQEHHDRKLNLCKNFFTTPKKCLRIFLLPYCCIPANNLTQMKFPSNIRVVKILLESNLELFLSHKRVLQSFNLFIFLVFRCCPSKRNGYRNGVVINQFILYFLYVFCCFSQVLLATKI